MSTVNVVVTARAPNGLQQVTGKVKVRLVAGPYGTPGHIVGTGEVVGSSTVDLVAGAVTLVLERNDNITPAGTLYEIKVPAAEAKWTVRLVAGTAGTVAVGEPTIQVVTPVPPGFAGGIPGPPGTDGATDVPEILATDHGVVGGGIIDDTDALQAAIDFCNTEGGGTVKCPAGAIKITDEIKVTENVNLVGVGGGYGQTLGGTTFKPASSTARITFGGDHVAWTNPASHNLHGGLSGNFGIDGSDGHTPSGALCIDLQVGRMFQAISITDCAGTGMLVEQAQNCHFDMIQIARSMVDGLVLDRGAGTNLFTKCEFAASARDGVRIQETYGDGPLPTPNFNIFDTCIIEYANPTTGTTRNNLRVTAGDLTNVFRNCVIANNDVATDGYLIHVEDAQVTFQSSKVAMNDVSTNGLYAKNAGLFFVGLNIFNSGAQAITFDTSGYGEVVGDILFLGTASPFTLLNGATLLNFVSHSPVSKVNTTPASMPFAERWFKEGETGPRLQVGTDGALQWYDGTSFTSLARLELYNGGMVATGWWQTFGKFQLQGPLVYSYFVSTLTTNGPLTLNYTTTCDHRIVLQANLTAMTISNPVNGAELTVTVIQDATGGRTYAWASNMRFAGNTPPTSTTPSTQTTVKFRYAGGPGLWQEFSRAVAVPIA